ncbi:hypothetical protein VTJ04DRAFT_10675 [Mycothermus thermophilus]|uniref:uncharacterized protein n=1 Tax=Humicola insolens TaxID=85995 RepID=UPI003742C146
MTEPPKRKDAPAPGPDNQRVKRKKTGNAGKWKTPHQLAKLQQHQDATLQPGDAGIWVTCARHQEGKAMREVEVLFSEYAEKLYGIKSVHDSHSENDNNNDNGSDEDEEVEEDLEAAIRKEVAALKGGSSSNKTNTGSNNTAAGATAGEGADKNRKGLKVMKLNVDCLLYVKTPPAVVDPVRFVREICRDAARADQIPGLMRCRYVNRLTPVSVMGRATEGGLVEVAREVLGGVFELKVVGRKDEEEKKDGEGGDDGDGAVEEEKKEKKEEKEEEEEEEEEEKKKAYTFAIRPTIRNHTNLKRDYVINTIAGLINEERHKVNLGKPDKVILVDIYQNVCGMSVVDGDWETELKRYNLTELYGLGRKAVAAAAKGKDA